MIISKKSLDNIMLILNNKNNYYNFSSLDEKDNRINDENFSKAVNKKCYPLLNYFFYFGIKIKKIEDNIIVHLNNKMIVIDLDELESIKVKIDGKLIGIYIKIKNNNSELVLSAECSNEIRFGEAGSFLLKENLMEDILVSIFVSIAEKHIKNKKYKI